MKPEERFLQLEEALIKAEVWLGDLTYNEIACEYDIYFDMMESLDEYQIDFNYGATRGCFSAPGDDFVFKFDFCGLDEQYCETEVYIYEEAKAAHLEGAFLKIQRFGELQGATVYIQKKTKYTSLGGYFDILKEDEEDEIEDLIVENHIHSNIPAGWIKLFINLYGLDRFKKFAEFINYYGINDLSESNLTIANKKPLLIDYAGYYE